MKKRNLKHISLALVLVMALGMLLGACGGSSSSSGMKQSASPAASNSFAAMDEGWYGADMDMAPAEAESWSEDYSNGGIESIKTETLDKANVKLIYRASMSVQTREFEETQTAIRQLVDGMGGWFENAESYYGSYYYGTNLRNAYYTIRIPADKYSDFLAAVGDCCHITNLSQSVEDVSLAYSDIETRLETLQTKHDRLIELLSKATEMTDIIDLENALSDCEYQIDSYTQSKNRYDSLIGYSTVNIDVNEVAQLADSVVEDQSFSARLGRSLSRGFSNFVDSLDDFVMWVSYHLIGIIIFIIIVIVAVRLIRSFKDPDKQAARRARKEEKQAERRAKAAEKRGGASPFTSRQGSAPQDNSTDRDE